MNESYARKAEYTRQLYPPGTRLVLDHMADDIQPVPAGTWGVVKGIDDGNNIHMLWENGRSLSLVPEADRFHKVTSKDLEGRSTAVRDAIQSYMVFEEETSTIYPFAATHEELPEETIRAIIEKCNGYLDTESIHAAIDSVVGINPELYEDQGETQEAMHCQM